MIPDKILNVFISSIKMVCDNIACYCNDPVSDFTRKRKLPVETLIHFIIQMQSKSLSIPRIQSHSFHHLEPHNPLIRAVYTLSVVRCIYRILSSIDLANWRCFFARFKTNS